MIMETSARDKMRIEIHNVLTFTNKINEEEYKAMLKMFADEEKKVKQKKQFLKTLKEKTYKWHDVQSSNIINQNKSFREKHRSLERTLNNKSEEIRSRRQMLVSNKNRKFEEIKQKFQNAQEFSRKRIQTEINMFEDKRLDIQQKLMEKGNDMINFFREHLYN